MYSLLQHIDDPKDLRQLSLSALPKISDELRQYIINEVKEKEGHIKSSLGVVELTVALHYSLNTPSDVLIWDVGHQAYGHKIITGRKKAFHTNRVKGGISGFPKASESIYDAFGVGHSSTSISAIMGAAVADKAQGKNNKHVAVIGDGALTGGMSFEALNNLGASDLDILIILNENGYSIDQNIGALKNKGALKAYFQSLNLNYTGIVDGHDAIKLSNTIKSLINKTGPKVLHIRTERGKGYPEKQKNKTLVSPPRYQDVFGHTLLELAKANDKIVGITPAMITGSSLDIMQKEMSNRVFDTGITEQHAVTLSAGMASKGLVPYCTIYSTFLQRAYDQIVHDVALQNLPVIFCIDRAGLVGADGATHHGVFDIAFLRSVPNMVIASPINETAFRNLLYTAQFTDSPIAIRYQRGNGVLTNWQTPFDKLEIGKGITIREGEKIAILSFGPIGNKVIKASKVLEKEGINIGHYDMQFAKPIDETLLEKILNKYESIITIEDGVITGGFGSTILEFMSENGYQNKLRRLGVPNQFIEHGTRDELYKLVGIDVKGIISSVKKLQQ